MNIYEQHHFSPQEEGMVPQELVPFADTIPQWIVKNYDLSTQSVMWESISLLPDILQYFSVKEKRSLAGHEAVQSWAVNFRTNDGLNHRPSTFRTLNGNKQEIDLTESVVLQKTAQFFLKGSTRGSDLFVMTNWVIFFDQTQKTKYSQVHQLLKRIGTKIWMYRNEDNRFRIPVAQQRSPLLLSAAFHEDRQLKPRTINNLEQLLAVVISQRVRDVSDSQMEKVIKAIIVALPEYTVHPVDAIRAELRKNIPLGRKIAWANQIVDLFISQRLNGGEFGSLLSGIQTKNNSDNGRDSDS